MPTAGVLQRIERVMVDAAKAVAGGVGYAFQVPSRTDVNQLYVPQLDRIVLKDKTSARKFADVGMCRKTTIMTRIMQLVHGVCAKNIHQHIELQLYPD